MGLHTKNLDRIIDKLIPMETLPSVLSNIMEKSVILDKMKQIEKDIPMIDPVEQRMQWEDRWIKLKCWLETYGE